MYVRRGARSGTASHREHHRTVSPYHHHHHHHHPIIIIITITIVTILTSQDHPIQTKNPLFSLRPPSLPKIQHAYAIKQNTHEMNAYRYLESGIYKHVLHRIVWQCVTRYMLHHIRHTKNIISGTWHLVSNKATYTYYKIKKKRQLGDRDTYISWCVVYLVYVKSTR